MADETPWTLTGKVHLAPAEPERADLALPINLATALKLADARPLVVAAAQAGAWVAEADLQRAKVLWVPTFNAGTDYIRHDGFGPDFNRGVNTAQRPLNQNINFLYSGIGLTQNVALSDAIFQPLAARQVLNASRWDIQTAKNDALLMTANAYFQVHQYRGQYAGSVDAAERGRKLVERLNVLSQDLVPRVEVDRAKRLLADLQQHVALARQNWRVASADLTQVLRLDPRVVIVPQEHDHLQITLIHADRPLDELIPIGLMNRPELASQQALVRAVTQRIRQEKGRLLMPSLLLNGFQTPNELIEFGAQGFGYDRKMNLWSLRDDLSPQAMWQYEGLGFGNMARIKEQRGAQSQALIEQFRIQDAVAADITRAQARASCRGTGHRGRSIVARRLDYVRWKLRGIGRNSPLWRRAGAGFSPAGSGDRARESASVVQQLLLDRGRVQPGPIRAIPRPRLSGAQVSALRPPGEVEPVDVSRPGYLPPVGIGPPPATR